MLMEERTIQQKSSSRNNFSLLFQLIASLSWVASVFVYGSYGPGDFLQLTAASAWTVSNILSYFKDKSRQERTALKQFA